MKFSVPIVVFGLLQLSLPLAIATADERKLRRGDESEQAIVNENLASEESDRELRPHGFRPGSIRRPGQSSRYGLNSLVGFRPYTNPNGFVAQPRQPPLTRPQQGVRVPPPKAGKAFKSAKALKSDKGIRQRRPRLNPNFDEDGTVAVIGIQRNPNSLAQSLGYFKVGPGTPVILVKALPAPTEEPTGSPTITPQPTGTPSISPTKQPTISPTKQPTSNPTKSPTNPPTKQPTKQPTSNPTKQPTKQPTSNPTKNPTNPPTKQPTASPTKAPVVV